MHYAVRPLIVFVRHWPQLAACYLLGVLGRDGAIWLAAWAGHDSDFWASAIMPFAGMARLGSYVAMFAVIRGAFPELAALPSPVVKRSDLFARVVVPFFAVYLAWQMFKEDWLAFEAKALNYRIAEAIASPEPTVLHPESLPVASSTVGLIVGALATRFVLNRVKERLPAWMTGVRLYVDALWVFLVLTFAVNKGLTWLINPAGWIAQRRIVVWFNAVRGELFSHAHLLETMWSTITWAVRTVFGGATLPLLWLAVAAIVYGVSAETTWRAAARRVVGTRADRWYDQAAPAGQRVQTRLVKTPKVLREKVQEYAVSRLGKFETISDSVRLIAHGGLLGMSLYVLAYVALAWLDMAGSFYATQFGPGYLFRGIAWMLGPHPIAFWSGIGDAVTLASHLAIEPLRVCVIAAALAYCLHHVAAAVEEAATTEGAVESDHRGP